MNDLVIIKTFFTRLEAEIVKGFLDSQGIKSVIRADDEGGMYPYPMQPTSSGVLLLVSKKDSEQATKLLQNNI